MSDQLSAIVKTLGAIETHMAEQIKHNDKVDRHMFGNGRPGIISRLDMIEMSHTQAAKERTELAKLISSQLESCKAIQTKKAEKAERTSREVLILAAKIIGAIVAVGGVSGGVSALPWAHIIQALIIGPGQ